MAWWQRQTWLVWFAMGALVLDLGFRGTHTHITRMACEYLVGQGQGRTENEEQGTNECVWCFLVPVQCLGSGSVGTLQRCLVDINGIALMIRSLYHFSVQSLCAFQVAPVPDGIMPCPVCCGSQ